MWSILYGELLIACSWIFVSNVYSQSLDCGYMDKHINEEGAFPWMVDLRVKWKNIFDTFTIYRCSGFLIDRRHVLTAANCLIPEIKSDEFKAFIGKNNRNEGEEYNITCVKKHPFFDPRYAYDDIAILTLSRDVDTPYYRPICLPDDNLRTKLLDDLTVVFYISDTCRYNTAPGAPGNRAFMQITGVRMISNKNCNKLLPQMLENDSLKEFPGAVSGDMFCALYPSKYKEGCLPLYSRPKGYIGAPLMYKDNSNTWYAVGMSIFTFGYNAESPRGYIKISEYVDWILENTKSGNGECS